MSLNKCPECGKEVSSSAKVCPNCGKKLKKSLFVKIILWTLGIFVGLAVIGAFLGDDKSEGGSSPAAKSKNSANQLETQMVKALINDDAKGAISSGSKLSGSHIGECLDKEYSQPKSVSGLKLAQDYEKNEVKADADYKGKWLIVNGTVASIDKTLGESHLTLQGFNPFLPTTAFFKGSKDELNQKLASVNKGQKVLLLCKGAGKTMTPTLRDCRFFNDAVENMRKKLEEDWVSSFSSAKSENASVAFIIALTEERMTDQQKQECLNNESACLKAMGSVMSKFDKEKEGNYLPERLKEIGYTIDMLKSDSPNGK